MQSADPGRSRSLSERCNGPSQRSPGPQISCSGRSSPGEIDPGSGESNEDLDRLERMRATSPADSSASRPPSVSRELSGSNTIHNACKGESAAPTDRFVADAHRTSDSESHPPQSRHRQLDEILLGNQPLGRRPGGRDAPPHGRPKAPAAPAAAAAAACGNRTSPPPEIRTCSALFLPPPPTACPGRHETGTGGERLRRTQPRAPPDARRIGRAHEQRCCPHQQRGAARSPPASRSSVG